MKINFKYQKHLLAVISVLFLVISPAFGQTRGGDMEIVDSGGMVVGRFLESHALVIGEGEYTNGYRRLPLVKEDVTAITRLFQEQGFNVEILQDANSRGLRNGITDFLDRYGYNPDARLILYFAGHGETLDLGGRRMGYIVPVDSPRPGNDERGFLQTAIPMTQFETWAKQYTSRHILFIFDSCFSGSVFRSMGAAPPAINRLINQPVRQFITSGDANEEVPDDSIFRRELEHGLRSGAADLNNDGYISGTELGLYLYQKVSGYMNGRQNPRTGKLNDADLDKGDFIFTTGNLLPEMVQPQENFTITIPPRSNVIIPDQESPQSFTNAAHGTRDYFTGTWTASVEYNNSFDTYQINFSANGRCTVKISNARAEQETTGNWTWDGTVLKLTARFRNARINYQQNIDWAAIVGFVDDYSFNINAKAAANGQPVLFLFFRE